MVPKGVTVRKIGQPLLRAGSNNVLGKASRQSQRERAIRIVTKALGLPWPNALADHHISDSYRWSKIDPATRLKDLSHWLEAECYQLMNLVAVPDPKDTVGTRD